MERQLATVQLIKDILPIEGKDRIVTALLESVGWQLVTQLSNGFKKGDKVVLFEIDAVLPKEEWCSFLGDNRTIKSRRFGQVVSQGLILPIESVPGVDPNLPEGEDLTKLLGVVEYERPNQIKMGEYVGSFPSHIISKTDEVLIQSIPKLIEQLKGKPYYITEKLDGSSATYLWEKEFIACSRNIRVGPISKFYKVGIELGFDRILKEHPWLVLQGELVGSSIQSNCLKLDYQTVFIFNMFDRTNKLRLGIHSMLSLAQDLGLPLVPLLERGASFNYTIPELVEKSIGLYTSGIPREGIVVRPADCIWNDSLVDYLSFKVINPDYVSN